MRLIENFDNWNRLYESAQASNRAKAINEAEQFDLMKWLKQQANVAKATQKIKKLVQDVWKDKTEQLNKEAEFEETWLETAKDKEQEIRDKFKTKISKVSDKNAKDGLRAQRKEQLEKLDAALSELKTAKKDQYLQSVKDDISRAEKAVEEIKKLDMPEWGGELVNAMATAEENAQKVTYYNKKYADNEESNEKAQKRLREKQTTDAKALAAASEQASLSKESDATTAIASIDNEKPTEGATAEDTATFKEGKNALKAALQAYKTANSELASTKRSSAEYKQAEQAAEGASDDQKEAKQAAADSKRAKFDDALDEFNKAKDKAISAFSKAISWADNNAQNQDAQIQKIVNQVNGTKPLKDDLEGIDINQD